jgi:hypothetical protein
MALTKAPEELVDKSLTSTLTITTADNSNNLVLASTDADASFGPRLKLFRNSASAADGDAIGYINFTGTNDAGTPEEVGYAAFDARIVDASDGTEDGRLEIVTLLAGVEGTSRILMDATETVFNDNSKDLDFRVESDDHAHALFVNGAAGNVGIGDTVPAWGANYRALTIGSSGAIWCTKTGTSLTALADNTYFNGSNQIARNTQAAAQYYMNAGSHVWENAPSVSAGATQTMAVRMVINPSGHITIGRTATSNTESDHGIDLYGNGYIYLYSAASGNDDTFRSYDSSGALKASIEADGDYIDHSDENYKENITDASSVLSTISDIKIRSFTWKDSGRKQSYGFVAQELKDVVPEATKVAEKEGDMWGVRNSRIVPMLVKAIQEQQTLIETLQTKVKALEEA